MQFKGKRVVITGSSRGIGLACAREFLRLGARVAVNGRSANSTQSGLDELDAGERALAAPGDVSTRSGCQDLVELAAEQLGGIDVLINSAGIGTGGPIEECTEAIDVFEAQFFRGLKFRFGFAGQADIEAKDTEFGTSSSIAV